MNRTAIFAPLAALSMIVAAAPAAATAKGQDAPETASAGKAEKKTCRRFDDSTSRMKSTKLCLTKAQWKKFEDAR